eukprot:14064131-Alexandrium_andersonii.AAC.1
MSATPVLQPGRLRVLAQGRLLVARGRARGVEPRRREEARGEEAPAQQHAQVLQELRADGVAARPALSLQAESGARVLQDCIASITPPWRT